MLLNNYIKAYKQNLLSFEGANYPFITNLNYSYRVPNGNTIALASTDFGDINPLIQPPKSEIYVKTYVPASTQSAGGYRFFAFGDGDTPVTLDDYSISGVVIPNINCVSITGGDVSNGVRQSYVFTNNNSSTVTIKELCIYGNFSGGTANYLALWREVFTTPLIVEAGASFLYNIDVITEA